MLVFQIAVVLIRAQASALPHSFAVTQRLQDGCKDIIAENRSIIYLHNSNARASSGHPFRGVTHTYDSPGFRGYAGHFDTSVTARLEQDAEVDTVESDQISTVAGIVQQDHATLGLGQISSRNSALKDKPVYLYDESAGRGTFAYVVDTGINIKHQDFEGRAVLGFNIRKKSTYDDQIGHGTHVAGLIGSKTYGVAKETQLIAVKVFGRCMFNLVSWTIAGYQWAVNDIISRDRQSKAIINMSLYGPRSSALNQAVASAFNSGITTVTCAGNTGMDARHFSPASSEYAMTVASTSPEFQRPEWSNWGKVVDIFAPGVDISSTWKGARSTKNLTGTSMSSAYVAGLALYLKGLKALPNATATKECIQDLATRDIVANANGSANLFAYNGATSRLILP
ncbi:subtilisin-like protein [Myriangium duriaei CBS 260.36]|uniref:Subtilisin-like protein n=1 Tax=Myriangium duriaei CBS 260.36 TaxID=1168546 RepID=A0A9P4J4D5_9PEZI|nr:subtilisin-like protein [Myriangium duriaei CBS 260.36]